MQHTAAGEKPKKEGMSSQQKKKKRYKKPRHALHEKLPGVPSCPPALMSRIVAFITLSAWMEHISIPAMGLWDGMRFISAGKIGFND